MTLSRRSILSLAAGPALARRAPQARLDRKPIVSRHNPELHALDPRSPLSVGNGEFAFTADITGLQTFPGEYERDVPLCTQSQWGWHSFPLPAGLDPSQLRLEPFETYGRKVGYATSATGQETLFNWLRENPHRLNLGRIGLLLDGQPPLLKDVTAIGQKLDLWTGILESRFHLQGHPVTVTTCCHPERDAVAVAGRFPLAASGRLAVSFDAPYGSPAVNASDWKSSERHRTGIVRRPDHSLELERRLDGDRYFARLEWEGDARAESQRGHRLVLSGAQLDLVCEFSRRQQFGPSPAAKTVRESNRWTASMPGLRKPCPRNAVRQV